MITTKQSHTEAKAPAETREQHKRVHLDRLRAGKNRNVRCLKNQGKSTASPGIRSPANPGRFKSAPRSVVLSYLNMYYLAALFHCPLDEALGMSRKVAKGV
jgi:hypothetical protein